MSDNWTVLCEISCVGHWQTIPFTKILPENCASRENKRYRGFNAQLSPNVCQFLNSQYHEFSISSPNKNFQMPNSSSEFPSVGFVGFLGLFCRKILLHIYSILCTNMYACMYIVYTIYVTNLFLLFFPSGIQKPLTFPFFFRFHVPITVLVIDTNVIISVGNHTVFKCTPYANNYMLYISFRYVRSFEDQVRKSQSKPCLKHTTTQRTPNPTDPSPTVAASRLQQRSLNWCNYVRTTDYGTASCL